MFPTQNLYELDETEYDALPFGMLALADDGTVLVYNAAEERLSGLHRSQVVGRNFFTEVAPCTRVREFEGVFRDMVQARAPARHAFDFLFRFQSGERFVHIAIVYDAAMARAVILVQTAQVQDTDVPTTR